MGIVFSNSHCKKIFIILQRGFLFFLMGCSGLEQSEQDKLREQNAKGEYIYRHDDEIVYPIIPPRHREAEPYPWDSPAKK
jgi:gluconate kinase